MESFEKSFLEKAINKGKKFGNIEEPDVQVEKKEENDFHSVLRR